MKLKEEKKKLAELMDLEILEGVEEAENEIEDDHTIITIK